MLKNRFRLSVRILAILAESDKRVTMADIADTLKVSGSYAEQLFACLRKADLVYGHKGPGGGYAVNRERLKSLLLIDIARAAHPGWSPDPLEYKLFNVPF